MRNQNYNQKNRAFTLLEMLLVIAIIAILAGIVIVAINPGRQLAQARNSQRWSDIRSLHAAVQQYYIDNKAWPAGLGQTEIDGTMLEVCRSGETSGCLDLESSLVPTYLSAVPEDPQASAAGTLYRIGINPTTKTANVLAVNSTEYDLQEVEIVTPCGDPANELCWSQQTTKTWGPTNIATGAQSSTDGLFNTKTIMTFDGSFPAAEYCYNLDEDGYTDWYLPSGSELQEGWNEFGALIFTTSGYWTSSETNGNPYGNPLTTSWLLSTALGSTSVMATKDQNRSLRCIR